MRKIISVLALVLLVLPLFAFAQNTCTIVADLSYIDPDCVETYVANVDTHGQCCLFNSIHVMTRWLSGVIAAIVGLLIIYGALLIITAGGEPEKVTQGKRYIFYAVGGLVVFLFARAIPSIARAILGI